VRTSLTLTVKQDANFIGILTSYSGAGCKLPRKVRRLHTGRVRTPSGYSHEGCEPPREEGLQELSFGLDNNRIFKIFLVRHLIQDRKCLSMD
jgi:hypothetical protein